MPFPKTLFRKETQTASSRFWTLVADSIFHDDNRYRKVADLSFWKIERNSKQNNANLLRYRHAIYWSLRDSKFLKKLYTLFTLFLFPTRRPAQNMDAGKVDYLNLRCHHRNIIKIYILARIYEYRNQESIEISTLMFPSHFFASNSIFRYLNP